MTDFERGQWKLALGVGGAIAAIAVTLVVSCARPVATASDDRQCLHVGDLQFTGTVQSWSFYGTEAIAFTGPKGQIVASAGTWFITPGACER